MTELDEQLQSHALWLETAGASGERLTLVGQHHPGTRLDGLDLSHAWLYDCDLTDASLRDTWLRGALLHGSILDRADLTRARLSKAEGEKVSAQGAILVNADLTRLWASEWNLTGADLTHSYLLKTVFTDSDLTRVRLVDADLDRTRFRRTTLTGITATGTGGSVVDDGTDPAHVVDLLAAAGATDVALFDVDTFVREDYRRWRHPLSTTAPG